MVQRTLATLICAGGALGVACGSSGGSGSFTLDFPSTAVAVATDAVQVQVYDGSDPNACTALIILARSQQAFPPLVTQTSISSPCALVGGGGSLSLKEGNYAFFAIGQHQGQNFVLGCQVGGVNSGGGSVNIELELFANTVAIPATTCAHLSQHCSGGC